MDRRGAVGAWPQRRRAFVPLPGDRRYAWRAMTRARIHVTVHGGRAAPIRHAFHGDSVTIGRQASCDLAIADLELSREHARLSRRPEGGWLIEDLGSRNGTMLNGRRVEVPSPVDDGDEVSLGASTLVIALPPGDRPRIEEAPTARPDVARPTDPVLVGDSPAMARIRAAIDRMATSGRTVLVTGESGTGKELVAELLHRRSERAARPYVVINCPAIPPSLHEAELFGVERGVATGVEARTGRFEAAQGGTLFLDEIGDMDLIAQAKILRALQQRTIERVGGKAPISLDVRVLAATHHDLDADVAKGTFRGDLLHRLRVLTLHLPPLRERREDILPLAEHFLALEGLGHRFADDAKALLQARDFPGNVRELQHAVANAVVAADGLVVEARHFPPRDGPRTTSGADAGGASSRVESIVEGLLAGDSFWDAVHAPFLRRELSREDAREIVRRLYDAGGGSYRGVARLLRLESEYQRIFAFLKNHDLRVGG